VRRPLPDERKNDGRKAEANSQRRGQKKKQILRRSRLRMTSLVVGELESRCAIGGARPNDGRRARASREEIAMSKKSSSIILIMIAIAVLIAV
jgi:hypothetical protein